MPPQELASEPGHGVQMDTRLLDWMLKEGLSNWKMLSPRKKSNTVYRNSSVLSVSKGQAYF